MAMAHEVATRYMLSASEMYDQLEFNTSDLFNEPAPEPWVAFLIGGVSTCKEYQNVQVHSLEN
jgi:hypothetical protein